MFLSNSKLSGNVDLFQQSQTRNGVPQNSPQPFVPERRLVHFDLKGAPAKIDYLKLIIPLLAQLGATGLLLEYEDMFPYEGILEPVRATNHYSKSEVIKMHK